MEDLTNFLLDLYATMKVQLSEAQKKKEINAYIYYKIISTFDLFKKSKKFI